MSYDELLRDMERALVAIDASKPYRYEPTTSLPALSPQMQAALGAEAEMVASVVKRAREMEAELLAALARIAKLEQEPPMALVDLGVGVNWKGLREDMQRLRAERDAARAQLHADDLLAWETLGRPEGTYETTNVQRLCAEVERLREQVRCRACDGTVGDHLAPDQGGCPGRFVIDGVEMAPAAHRSGSDG